MSFERDIPLSDPELFTIARIPVSEPIRIAFFGPRLDKSGGSSLSVSSRSHLRMPSADQTHLAIRSNGPCRQCRTFLQKLARLVREENTDILGILELTNHGHYIHDILSDKSLEYLGSAHSVLLAALSGDGSTHDRHNEYRKPCPICSSCTRLLDWDSELRMPRL